MHPGMHASMGGGDGGNTCAADEFTLSHILGSTLLGPKYVQRFVKNCTV